MHSRVLVVLVQKIVKAGQVDRLSGDDGGPLLLLLLVIVGSVIKTQDALVVGGPSCG